MIVIGIALVLAFLVCFAAAAIGFSNAVLLNDYSWINIVSVIVGLIGAFTFASYFTKVIV